MHVANDVSGWTIRRVKLSVSSFPICHWFFRSANEASAAGDPVPLVPGGMKSANNWQNCDADILSGGDPDQSPYIVTSPPGQPPVSTPSVIQVL